MPLNFPSSPTVDQEYSYGNRMWRWNGTTWAIANANLATSSLDDIGNVDLAGASAGEFLKYDGTDWVSDSVPTINTLDDVGDVTITSPASGEVLKWNGSAWTNAADEEGTTINAIDDIGDVTITSASANQFLRWNGSAWVNETIDTDDIGEGSTNQYYTDARARGAVTADLGGVGGGTRFIAPAANADVQLISHEATHAVVVQSNGIAGAHVIIKGSAEVIPSASIADPGNLDVAGSVTIGGDLTVSGTSTTLNTTELTVEDNVVTLNSGATGAPSLDAGIEVERGSSANVAVRWNESSDTWQITEDGTNYYDIATSEDIAGVAINSLDDIGDVTITSASSGQVLKWNGSAWINETLVGGATVSSSAPASPTAGQLWFDSDTAQTFVYYDSAWVEIAGSNTSLASLANIDDVDISVPADGDVLVWDSTSSRWVNTSEYSEASIHRNITRVIDAVVLDSSYAGKTVEIDSSSSTIVSIPVDQISPWETGTSIDLVRYGSGSVTVAGGTGTAAWADFDLPQTGIPSFQPLFVKYVNGLWWTGGVSSPIGRVFSSTDAVTWVSRSIGAAYTTVADIAYGNGTYVAAIKGAGPNSNASRSTDGITWTSITSITTQTNSVAFGNGTFVLGLSSGVGGTVLTSTDAITWTTRATIFGATFTGVLGRVTYANSVFIAWATISTRIATSTDAVTWATFTGSTSSMSAIAHNGSRWISASDSGVFRSSTDLVTWVTGLNSAGVADSAMGGINFQRGDMSPNGQYAIATDSDTISSPFIYSRSTNNGVTWTTGTFPTAVGLVPDVAVNNSGIHLASGSTGLILRSTDGISWTTSYPKELQQPYINTPIVYATALGEYYAGTYAGTFVQSTDGVTWEDPTNQVVFGTIVNGLAYANGTFVICGNNGYLARSTDALTWTTSNITTTTLNAVAYGNGLFVVAGAGGFARYSTDAVTWATASGTGTTTFYDIKYGNSSFAAAVNSAGTILRSTDGITWTSVVAIPTWTSSTFSVAYGNGTYVVGSNSRVAMSTDTVTWTSVALGPSSNYVGYAHSRFYSLQGTNLLMYSSTDGLTWTTVSSTAYPASNSQFFPYAVNSSLMLFANTKGHIFTSTDGVTFANGYNHAIGTQTTSSAPWSGPTLLHWSQADSAFFALAYQDSSNNVGPRLAKTTDGMTWSVVKAFKPTDWYSGSAARRFEFAPSSDSSLVVWRNYAESSATTSLIRSTNGGATFTEYAMNNTLTPATATTNYGVVYYNGLWVRSSSQINGVHYSTDAVAWTSVSTYTFASVITGLGLLGSYVVALTSSTMYRSTDGITWTSVSGLFDHVSSMISTSYRSFGTNSKLWFIAPGNSGLMYTTDGVTPQFANILGHTHPAAPGSTPTYNPLLVTVGSAAYAMLQNGYLASSTDGLRWTFSPVAPWRQGTALGYNNGLFVAGLNIRGQTGIIAKSGDVSVTVLENANDLTLSRYKIARLYRSTENSWVLSK